MNRKLTAASAARTRAPDSGEGRYEFRIFRPHLDRLADVLDAIAGAGRFEASVDRYVLVPGRLDSSLKLRDGALELKTLSGSAGPLEQWNAPGRVALPASGRDLDEVLLRAGVSGPSPDSDFADAAELAEWFAGRPGIAVVAVRKRRRKYLLEAARAEIGEVAIGNRTLRTLALEGTRHEVVAALVLRLGLRAARNTSYPRLLHELRTA
jgi:hypothetical protein